MSEVAVIAQVNADSAEINFSVMNIEVFRWYQAICDGSRAKISEDVMDILGLDEEEIQDIIDELEDNSDFVPEALLEETFETMLELFEYVKDSHYTVVDSLNVFDY